MKINKIIFLVLIFACVFFLGGCSETGKEQSNDITGTTNIKESIVSDDFDENGVGMLKCSTEAYAEEGMDVELRYTLKYKNGNILELVSVQKVISEKQDSLSVYENAYKNIANNYKDLCFYDTSIVRESNSVSYTAIINYEKINIDKLLRIEGEEDNIIKNGKAKLSLWLELAGKVGTVCEEV